MSSARGVDYVWGTAVAPDAAVARLLSPIVLAAAELLTSADVTHVRRRWCTMQSCGNRAKARRFERERQSPKAGHT